MTQVNESASSSRNYGGAVEALVAVQSLAGMALHIHSWSDLAAILDSTNPVMTYGTGHLVWSVVSGLGLCIYKARQWVKVGRSTGESAS